MTPTKDRPVSVQPIHYGPNSPFTPEERQAVEEVYGQVVASGHPEAEALRLLIYQQICCLEWLGEVLAQYPSPLGEQRLGRRRRGLRTLVDSLSHTNPANFEFFVPTRALLGRALDMAESNFYRLLRHVCREILHDDRGRKLREDVTQRLRVCLYTKLTEEVLSAIASDGQLDRSVRERAVLALAQIWEHRLTYRVSDFFPILEATWEARQRISVIGGTLAGTQELFQLFREGCDPKFVDYFTRPDPDPNEIEAFREFLFATSAEELDRLAAEMAEEGIHSITLHDSISSSDRDAASVFYEFFRSRYMLATARQVTGTSGPRHTAEGYVMIFYLGRMT